MEAYIQLIKSIEPNQKEMVSQPELLEDLRIQKSASIQEVKSHLMTELEADYDALSVQIQKQFKLTETTRIIPSSRKRSLYVSLLSLIDQKYSMTPLYEDKCQMVSESIKFMIAQLTINQRVRTAITNLKVRVNQLIDEIKDETYQSSLVVYYLSLLFDINIIVLSELQSEKEKNIEVEFYFGEDKYDNCKAHLVIFRDQMKVYSPVILGSPKDSQLLTYYNHPIIQELADSFDKKIICAQNYIKLAKEIPVEVPEKVIKKMKDPINLDQIANVNLNKLSLAELREIAQSCQIETQHTSSKTGKQIHKTKAELIADLR